jgi:hypothetical protein
MTIGDGRCLPYPGFGEVRLVGVSHRKWREQGEYLPRLNSMRASF